MPFCCPGFEPGGFPVADYSEDAESIGVAAESTGATSVSITSSSTGASSTVVSVVSTSEAVSFALLQDAKVNRPATKSKPNTFFMMFSKFRNEAANILLYMVPQSFWKLFFPKHQVDRNALKPEVVAQSVFQVARVRFLDILRQVAEKSESRVVRRQLRYVLDPH